MKLSFFRVRSYAVTVVLSACFAAQAQVASPVVLKEVVVTATRVEQPLSDLVADVTIVDRDAIERSGVSGVSDVLRRLPGVEMVRNGGIGGTTSVYIRGSETRFTAVYVDGVRVDSQSTGGASWEGLPLAQIDRIEVLRGSAAAVYGSDSLGGVIQIFTRKGEGAFSPYVAVGAGTYGTSSLNMGFSGADGDWDYALGAAAESSRGYNSRSTATANPDDDGYRNQSGNLRVGLNVTPQQHLEGTLLYSDLTSQYDSSPTKDDLSLHLLQATGLNWKGRWSDAYSTTVSVTDTLDRYETTPSVYLSTTRLRGYLFQNEYRLGQHLITGALERREDNLNNASTAPRDTSRFQNALALGYGWHGSLHTVQLNVRQDQDSEFGAQNTGSAAWGLALTPQWRATASVGTAFRAPTLFQRFSTYGTPDLQPESSRNVEFGVRYAQGSSLFSVTTYLNRVTNLITYVSGNGSCTNGQAPVLPAFRGCYANTAEAQYRGVTFAAEHTLGAYQWHGSLDLQDPRDSITGKLLARRATHHAVIGVDTHISSWSVGADAQLSALRYDDAANTVVLPAYTVINLSAQNRVARDWTLLVRVDNATDTVYQLANTYVTPGRSLYVGLKWAP
ncbi:MAG: TonB-dependent receptor [Rhodoferax sp.]